MDVTSRQAANRLHSAVLALHSDCYHLSHAGSRRERAYHLWSHLQAEDQSVSKQSASDPGHSDTEQPDEETEQSDFKQSETSGSSAMQTVADKDESQS